MALLILPTYTLQAQLTNGMTATGVLGQSDFVSAGSGTAQNMLKGPNGVSVDPTTGKLFVVDRSNNRVLRYGNAAELQTGSLPEAVFGQSDFTSASTGTTANKFNQPIGIHVDANGTMWIGDYGNNRVLRFKNASSLSSGADADGVIGQPNFTTSSSATTQAGLAGPVGIMLDHNGTLWVSGFGNHRVTWYKNAATLANGANADGVFGQPDFTSSSGAVGPGNLFNPNSVYTDPDGNLYVSDYTNKRVLRYNSAADKANGAAADAVYGQPDFTSNASGVTQTQFGTTRFVWGDQEGRLYVVEEANNRVMIFNDAKNLGNGAPADYVLGQSDFTTGTGLTTAVNLKTPRAIYVHETPEVSQIWLADYNNHRVLWYQLTEPDTAEVVLTHPTGGEQFFAGDTTDITWTAKAVDTVAIEISYDNRETWSVLADSLPAGSGTLSWIIPDSLSDQVWLRIYDEAKPKHADTTDAAFSIVLPPPDPSFISVVNPKGGEAFRIGEEVTLIWSVKNVDSVTVEASYDSLATWEILASGLPSESGKLTWTVPAHETDNGFIRISDFQNPSVSDTSDSPFSIHYPPYEVKVISPNGYQSWVPGSKKQLLFTAKEADSLEIWYSADGGLNWNLVSDRVSGSQTSFNWTVPADTTSNGRIRIQVKGLPDFGDESDNPFKIRPAATGGQQDLVFFSAGSAPGYWDSSWGFANAPSTLELMNGSKFPVSAEHALLGNYSLKLKWTSGTGGDWMMAAAADGWVGNDATSKDFLEFRVLMTDQTDTVNYPKLFLEDLGNKKSDKISWASYVSETDGSPWKKVRIPIKSFMAKPGAADFTRIKTIFWAQDQTDAVSHTWFIDDLRMTGGKIINYDSLRTIVILGSSTSAGIGPTVADSAYVNRFRKYVQSYDKDALVINLAVGGYTTYDVMPTGFVPPSGRPTPKVNNNITKALSYHPDAILINLPSNDANLGYSVADQLKNYSVLDSICDANNIPVWVTTTQPRNLDTAKRNLLMVMRDSTIARYGDHCVDFWTELANADGTINNKYNSGDGIHLNNAGHRVLFNRVVEAKLWNQLYPVSVEQAEEKPAGFLIEQNFPNPFNPETTVTYHLPDAGLVNFNVFNVLGQQVYSSHEVKSAPGSYQFRFNGAHLASGMYWLTISMKQQSGTIRMVLLK